MGVIQHKIWHDLWHNKGRTIQAVLTIAIGAFAVGLTLGASDLMGRGFQDAWQSSFPAMISLEVDPPIDEEMLDSLKSIRGVVEVEGELTAPSIKWHCSPDEAWAVAHLTARDDYDNLKLNNIELRSGDWPTRKQMSVETGYNLQAGDSVYLQVDNETVVGDRTRYVELRGVVFNQLLMTPAYGGHPTFYTTRNHFAEITGQSGFRIVRVIAAEFDQAEVTDLANRIQDHLKKQDIESKGAGDLFGKAVTDPNQHPFHEIIDGLNFVLVVMAFLSLILGLFLVFTTMTALISRQTNQIGIMKAVGAGSRQILRIYLSNVLVYGGLALLLALPLGAAGAYGLYASSLTVFGLIPGPFEVSPLAIVTQIVITLVAPLLAAIVPVTAGARITVREAIGSYGLGGTVGLLEKLLVKFQFMPRKLALMISNTFRNKKRIALTLLTLTGQEISIIVGLLSMMAIVMAIVGSIALSGVLSINVMERRREIGVMRAIGASSVTIAGLFIGEGLTLGLLSWLIALPLSLPASWLMSKALGVVVMSEVVYRYSEVGVLYWFIIIVALSVLASWLPAKGATDISVRESLMYQ